MEVIISVGSFHRPMPSQLAKKIDAPLDSAQLHRKWMRLSYPATLETLSLALLHLCCSSFSRARARRYRSAYRSVAW
jgi:hypothetical protein